VSSPCHSQLQYASFVHENKIIGNIHTHFIVTIYHHWLVVNDTHFIKERLNPHQFTSCMSHDFILSFNTGSSNTILFFTSPCHQIASNKSVIISSRPTINRIISPISIRISHNIQMRGRMIIQPFIWSPFKNKI